MKKFLTIAVAALALAACNPEQDEPTPVVLDFESVPASSLAGPTAYGENLYEGFEGEQFTSYTDTATGLTFGINESNGEYNFWNGGVAPSRWADSTTAGLANQCSVYAPGGQGSSQTFAVVNYSAFENRGGEVYFADPTAEATFDHVWVANATYTALSMKNGDDYARRFEAGDWFLLTITARDKTGAETGTPVEFYLADLRTASSPGILDDWAKVDLTPLGQRVHSLEFTLSSSDTGEWGMNTPGYFCFDNLAFFK
jgi:hypothetical protein